jgi:hypothetical protein
MPPFTPIPRPEPGPPVNAASTDDTPAVQGTSLTSLNPLEFGTQLGGAVGVIGTSGSGIGVQGESTSNWGVGGTSQSGAGVVGQSTSNNGVEGTTSNSNMSGVVGVNTAGGNGVYGTSVSGNAVAGKSQTGNAGWFDGPVYVNGNQTVTGTVTVDGDIVLTNAADCAEEFDVTDAAEIEPGTVMVLDQHGAVRSSCQAYDKKVAGVISGAGDYKPGMILDKKDASESRMPIALLGKVYCKVDAQYAPVEVGDLLTTSPTPGHAMKADDPFKAFGAVIGKALRPLPSGQAMIPVLIALQ